MARDAFAQFHPLANFLFFVGAIGFGVVIQHPAYTIAGAAGAVVYFLLLTGRKGLKLVGGMAVLFVIVSLINPVFNVYGETVLFTYLGRPYALEGLCYGIVIAGMFVLTILWFACYSRVLTGDRFISLFGRLIPSLSLLLVMVLRMVPDLIRKSAQISGARRSIGKGAAENSSLRERTAFGMTVLSALTDRALEDSVVTSDSMLARGYGSAKRTSFQIYRVTARDIVLIIAAAALAAAVIACGGTSAVYTPSVQIDRLTPGFIAYCVYVAIPSFLRVKENLTWHILRSGI